MRVINVIDAPEGPFKTGSAREAWWERIQRFNGMGLDAFAQDVTKDPPSLQPNGKFGKAGGMEPPMGWVSFFVRTELVKIEEAADKPNARKRAPARKRTTSAA